MNAPPCEAETGHEAPEVLPRYLERGVDHPQRLKYPLLEELSKRHLRDGLYYRPELHGDSDGPNCDEESSLIRDGFGCTM